jgi:hypothetical protein
MLLQANSQKFWVAPRTYVYVCRCCSRIIILCCGVCSSYPLWAIVPCVLVGYGRVVARIFHVAVYAVRTFVVSSCRGFCVGGLPVDIWAVSNVEVYSRPVEGEICEVCVCTRVFIWPLMLEGSCCVRYGSSVSQFS